MLLAPEETALLELDDQLRRSACDRCRGQKLRCERPAGPGSAPVGATGGGSSPAGGPLATCRRCQRVGAVCTTSFQQRPGRPRLSDDSSRVSRRPRAKRAADVFHHRQYQRQQHQQRQQQNPVPASPSLFHPGTPWDEQEAPRASPVRDKSLSPGRMQKDHVSSASSADGSSGLAASTDSVTATFDQDHPDFWPLSPGDIVSSWDWDEENLPGLLSVDKGTSSSSNGGAPLNCEAADAAIAHTTPSEVGNNATSSERTCLCQRLADLSHSLSRDVHDLSSSLERSDPDYLGQDGNDRIQRAFKAFETFGSLVNELRTTTTTHNLQAQAETLLTPVSNSRWSIFSAGNDVCQHGGRGAQPSSKTTTAEVPACADHHLSMILALHIATSCACLNEILKRTLSSIHAALVSRQEGDKVPGGSAGSSSAGQLPRLPRLPGIIRIEGLPGDSNHLRVRLFAETCLHVATGAHKRLELLAAAVGDTMRCGFSRPLDMVLGRGSCDESHVDIHGIKLLCSQISSAIEEHAW